MNFDELRYIERLREVERELDLLRARIDEALIEPKALREQLDNAKDKIRILEQEVTTFTGCQRERGTMGSSRALKKIIGTCEKRR